MLAQRRASCLLRLRLGQPVPLVVPASAKRRKRLEECPLAAVREAREEDEKELHFRFSPIFSSMAATSVF